MGYLEHEEKSLEQIDKESWDDWSKRTRRKNWIEMGALGLFYLVAIVNAIIYFVKTM